LLAIGVMRYISPHSDPASSVCRFWGEAMDFFRAYAKEIVSLIVPAVSAIFARLSRARVRLTYSTPHGFTFLVQEPLRNQQGQVINPTQAVHTRSFWFRNQGRAPAHHVEIVFNWKPPCLNVWPSRHFEEKIEADNRYVLIFASLAPGESFGCELLSVNRELPHLITVRCDEGVARAITMLPLPMVPRWRVWVILVLAFLGFVAAIYLTLICLQWLILRTPPTL
jgi:hypothetical protein